jgi:hypothetical protein
VSGSFIGSLEAIVRRERHHASLPVPSRAGKSPRRLPPVAGRAEIDSRLPRPIAFRQR